MQDVGGILLSDVCDYCREAIEGDDGVGDLDSQDVLVFLHPRCRRRKLLAAKRNERRRRRRRERPN